MAQKKKQHLRLILANNIRKARMNKGLSQEALADLCGLHRTYIGSVERGERNISVDNIEALALALEMLPALLLSEEE